MLNFFRKIIRIKIHGLTCLRSQAPLVFLFRFVLRLRRSISVLGINQSRDLSPEEKQAIKERWQAIEETVKLGGEARLKQAIVSADNLIDGVLKQMKIAGQTMGERLKNSQRVFSQEVLDDLWRLHKLRNRIVHEEGEYLSFEITKMINKIKNFIEKL